MFLSEFRNRGLIWHRVNMAKGRYHGGIDFWHAEKRVLMARHIAWGADDGPSRREMVKQYPAEILMLSPGYVFCHKLGD